MALNIPLMEDNISKQDLETVREFLATNPFLTSSKKVKEFEAEWSKWLGVKHSVFVHSGSSANMMTMAALREMDYGSERDEIILPCITWVSDVVSVLQAGFKPVFCDLNPKTLALEPKEVLGKVSSKTRAVFLTHILGFNGLTTELLDGLKRRGVPLIEDACESHGAKFGSHLVGSVGMMSNFSFYYAHHMSTIEGGMICTNDERAYQTLRVLRSHGMVRESTDEAFKDRYAKEHPDLHPDFIFAYPTSNYRNNEIGAVLGLNQLPYLNTRNEQRQENLKVFLENLDPDKYFTEFDATGNSNYAFVLILKRQDEEFRDRLMSVMKENKVEFRRGTSGGGNQLRQPYLKRIIGAEEHKNYPVAEYIHFFGFYLGNYPTLSKDRVLELCQLLNSVEPSSRFTSFPEYGRKL